MVEFVGGGEPGVILFIADSVRSKDSNGFTVEVEGVAVFVGS